MKTIGIEAVTCIVASDQVWRNPGQRWACPAEEARGLIASGAAMAVDDGVTPPAAEPARRADRQGPAARPESPGVLTPVSGIGPSTEAALQAAG